MATSRDVAEYIRLRIDKPTTARLSSLLTLCWGLHHYWDEEDLFEPDFIARYQTPRSRLSVRSGSLVPKPTGDLYWGPIKDSDPTSLTEDEEETVRVALCWYTEWSGQSLMQLLKDLPGEGIDGSVWLDYPSTCIRDVVYGLMDEIERKFDFKTAEGVEFSVNIAGNGRLTEEEESFISRISEIL